MIMGNAFSNWTPEMVRAHNARILRQSLRETIHDDSVLIKTKQPKPVPPRFHDGESIDIQKLNKTERAFHQYLKFQGHQHLWVQQITLKLANDCRLTVDFVYLDKEGRMIFVDVKGFQREDALIKMKVAARLYPIFSFYIVKKDGAGWDFKEVKP